MTNDEIKQYLGETTIIVELSDENIEVARKLITKKVEFIKPINPKIDLEYLYDSLLIIECKKIWATCLMKYSQSHHEYQVNGKLIFDSVMEEEKIIIEYLKLRLLKGN